jgi:hypothetical protein
MDRLPSEYLHHTASGNPRFRKEKASEAERKLPAQTRLEIAVYRWCEEFGYIGFHGALSAARDALQEGDQQVALLLCRRAQNYLEKDAESSKERSERRVSISRRRPTVG